MAGETVAHYDNKEMTKMWLIDADALPKLLDAEYMANAVIRKITELGG